MLVRSFINYLITSITKFFKLRFSNTEPVNIEKINYQIRLLLNKKGIKKVNPLDHEIITVFKQKGNDSFVVIEKCNLKNNNDCILAVSINNQLVYLTGDYINQVYKPGHWESKLNILANAI